MPELRGQTAHCGLSGGIRRRVGITWARLMAGEGFNRSQGSSMSLITKCIADDTIEMILSAGSGMRMASEEGVAAYQAACGEIRLGVWLGLEPLIAPERGLSASPGEKSL